MVDGKRRSQVEGVTDDGGPLGRMDAKTWVATYEDQYVAECDDENEIWCIARAMAEDAVESGYPEVDVDEIMGMLKSRRG